MSTNKEFVDTTLRVSDELIRTLIEKGAKFRLDQIYSEFNEKIKELKDEYDEFYQRYIKEIYMFQNIETKNPL